jgi:hypothetical protein
MGVCCPFLRVGCLFVLVSGYWVGGFCCMACAAAAFA